ncbi:MAG: hypothetical protein A2Y92_04870 [Chloroflexi bacterium RBG_13_57_8]|nr:MAG: hypothetical protein A2Y92_04870 [Chloroflexi bacterium RBG_13_57_8]
MTEELVAGVNYNFQHEEDLRWWGELTLIEYKQIKDGGGYIIELEDGRRCRCAIKKRVNRAVTSLPPRYVYHFSGSGKFEY